ICEGFQLTDTNDAEGDFLGYAAFAFQYRQACALPLELKHIIQQQSAPEIKGYCSKQADGVLKALLTEDHPTLIELWLTCCVEKNLLVRADVLPILLDLGIKKKEWRKSIFSVAGERGAWLATLRGDWADLIKPIDVISAWETGSFDQRKEALRELRLGSADHALELLKNTWETEGTNEKVAFLDTLKVNLSISDLQWLESLKEKSQKVNNAVTGLLKLIPQSRLVSQYTQALKGVIAVKKDKALLGMLNRVTLKVNENTEFPDSIFKAGIDKLSSNKDVSDQQYIIIQLIEATPPAFHVEQLQLPVTEIVNLLIKDQGLRYLDAFAMSACRYRDVAWIKALLDQGRDALSGDAVLALLGALPDEDRDIFAIRCFDKKPTEITQLMLRSGCEWSIELAKAILKSVGHEIHHYNRLFFRQAAPLIPVALCDQLHLLAPAEEQKNVYWKNQADELERLLNLKNQIWQSFNA
ncbi:MAG: DUF5691 domain-containing protein, partial [Bacteroidota bacterium]